MLKLNIGCNFTPEHVKVIEELVTYQTNQRTRTRITEVYGSPSIANPFGSVRPSAREEVLNTDEFMNALLKLHSIGIGVNLTMNSLLPREKDSDLESNIMDSEYTLLAFRNWLVVWATYIDNLIMASPLLVDKLHEWAIKDSPRIILSTIMNVHSLTQLRWIKKNWPLVTRVCPALWKNRDLKWLQKANGIIPLELLANEFCSIGGVECEGLYRQACYLSQSIDAKWNPMLTRCIASRKENPSAWLKARFILPQWLKNYERDTGVSFFKITGRTHPAKFVEFISKAYIDEYVEGKLLELWGQLPAALDKNDWDNKQKTSVEDFPIAVKEVIPLYDSIKFCTVDNCGFTCNVCERITKLVLEKENV